ncbi:MAG TPA: hypothetical protein VFI96_03820 [Longimicrobiaceae bacterium]|nr:hypothetical protein [Longimicrobiaceae bacterium]
MSVAAHAPPLRLLLCEDDPVKRDWLAAGLPASCASVELRDGGEAPLAGVAEPVEGVREVLALLDPPQASRLPLAHLRPLLSHADAELLIRFPVTELRRLARCPASPLADLPPAARRVVEGVSALLGESHAWVAAWRAEGAAEEWLVERYARRLREAGGRAVRALALETEEGAPEWLLLVAPDALRALALNERVHELRQSGSVPWPSEETRLLRYESRGEMELFGGDGGVERERVVDRVGLAHAVARRFAGRTVPLAEVAAAFAVSELFAADLRRALADLRRDGRALYRSLGSPEAEVSFPRARVRQRRGARRRGGAGDGELGLMGTG